MGEPVLIRELAEKMIHLHGKTVGPAEGAAAAGVIEIDYIGLRPGEKLIEELVIGENITGTRHKKIQQAREAGIAWDEVEYLCEALADACEQADYHTVKLLLEKYVTGYSMAADATDPGFVLAKAQVQNDNVTRLGDHQKP